MSHEHLRKEKDCLNCGAAVAGDYCQNCGQRNVVPRQTFWHLVTHFFNDVTHFDGKFFVTLKLLFFRPGFLSAEWVYGKRTKYLDPIRMYLFISALFLIFIDALIPKIPATYYKPGSYGAEYLQHRRDSTALTNDLSFSWESLPGDTTEDEGVFVLSLDRAYMNGIDYYDSVQRALPPSEKDNAVERYFGVRMVAAYEDYDRNPYAFFPNVFDKLVHSASKIFFVSLPIFSFLLWLFYIRRRKQYYFVSHAIFSLHYYCVAFLMLAVFMSVMGLIEYLPDSVYDVVSNIALLAFLPLFFVYLLVAMKRFYAQNWFKTSIKAVLIFLIQSVLLFILICAFMFHSFLSMAAH